MDERERRSAARSVLASIAPGTPLRDGLERILRGRTGALLVIGHDAAVEAISDGGFRLDVEFSPTRLRELCKMDGAVVLSHDATRILRANVQLMPDSALPTEESGTRHRTAERVGLQTGLPVIAVSHSMSIINLYFGGRRLLVAEPFAVLARANQVLATLQRYRSRLDEVVAALTAAEIEDTVTLRETLTVLQRLLLVRRMADELHGMVIELGIDGRLLALQLDELVTGTDSLRVTLIRDYAVMDDDRTVQSVLAGLRTLTDTEILELDRLATGLGHAAADPDAPVSPRGYRLLGQIPHLSAAVADVVIGKFGGLQGLLAASSADLGSVDGVGIERARIIREGLSRLAESAIFR